MSQTQTLTENVQYYSKADVRKAQESGGRGLPLDKTYDCAKFWNEFGDEYFKAFVNQQQLQANTGWLIDRLKSIGGIATLLDVGCGFGRLLPFLLEAGVVKSCVGIDISEGIIATSKDYLNPNPSDNIKLDDYRKRLSESKIDDMLRGKLDELLIQQYAKRKQNPPDFRDKIELKVGDARKLEFESDSFDCVLSSESTQHLSPQDAEDAILHMVRVSRKAIVFIERFVYSGEHAQPDLWSHNYVDILNRLGVRVVQSSLISNGLQGTIAFKR